MRPVTIARNYAEALLSLAQKANDAPGWGKMLTDVSNAMKSDLTLRRFLESPKVSYEQKNEILARALQDRVPRVMVRYLQALVKNRRQMLIPQIVAEYFGLLDIVENRVHAEVTLAREPSKADLTMIEKRLGSALGKEIVAHMHVDPAILGGVIVKIGDTVMDGSVRRRLTTLRTRLVASKI
jgi:F-type H+-transporting ATPase subunit delta